MGRLKNPIAASFQNSPYLQEQGSGDNASFWEWIKFTMQNEALAKQETRILFEFWVSIKRLTNKLDKPFKTQNNFGWNFHY